MRHAYQASTSPRSSSSPSTAQTVELSEKARWPPTMRVIGGGAIDVFDGPATVALLPAAPGSAGLAADCVVTPGHDGTNARPPLAPTTAGSATATAGNDAVAGVGATAAGAAAADAGAAAGDGAAAPAVARLRLAAQRLHWPLASRQQLVPQPQTQVATLLLVLHVMLALLLLTVPQRWRRQPHGQSPKRQLRLM